uniref:TOG domain-containing protein n=1 Tax=Heliothis virescens TaxID=7102 RepID=A0A2A4JNE8_HELVI
MEDENEYKKLPTEEKCVHKLWKARVAGYEEAIKLFNQIDDEKSPEWNKYLGLIKKFVTDSNAVAQEKGLEAALVFVENCGHAGKTTGEVMSGIVAKCIAAPRTKTKDIALQITLMYIEIEKHEIVEEELIKGMEQKNPKVVAACVSALHTSLKQFGNKVIAIKPMVKKIPILLSDRDKGVRDEMKALVIEMHRWIGGAIEPHIASLQAVIQQELRESFSSGGGAAQPTRYLRSQQHRVRDTPAADCADGATEDDDAETGAGDSGEMDPYDLLDPVEILSKLPKDFYEKLDAKKWQERKEALDALENLLKAAPKLEPGDYADLVRALKKVISKDTNVMLVALGGRLLGMVATGLRNKFSPYACACVQAILEKFKEKKTNVVTALREAIDAIYPCIKTLVYPRWIGGAIEPHIASLQAVIQQELRESFSSGGGAAQPTRYLRSQQHRVRDTPAADCADGATEDDDAETGAGDSGEMDPYDLLDPVEILSKLPKDFYEKLDAKKWQERKEALDALENLLKAAPKLEPGDYADLVRALKKVISKDTNVMLVALGGRLLGMVATGLRNKFSPYACACVQAILEKFKEKKTNVVTALREAIDAIYPCTNLEAIMEDMLAAFDNKNPSIKAESSLFLARALCHTQPTAFGKKLVKAYVGGLLKLLESADPAVRDAAAEALGTATKLVGEKNIAPHIGKLDNLKEQKIKEFADKAVIQVKVAAPKKDTKAKPTPSPSGKGDAKPTAGSSNPKPVRRPNSAKVPAKKAPASRAQPSPPREQELSQEEVDAKAEMLFPADVVSGMLYTLSS